MVFVFDLDDTICDTDKYSEKYMLRFFKEHNLPYKQIAKNVRFAEKKFDWDYATALNWYKQYGDEMMTKFPYNKNICKFINGLYDAGHKIVIATARANDWHTDPEGITLEWLKRHKFKYHKIYIGRIDKEKICEEENADVFVDDDIKYTTKVDEYFKSTVGDKKVFLKTTAYNKTLPTPDGVVRINKVEDILNFLPELQIRVGCD